MERHLKLLISLQEFDSLILEKQLIINGVPSKTSEAEVLLEKAQAVLDKMKQRHESLEKKKRGKERELDDINEKIIKLKARTAEIKTNKEYQAHLKEIESAEKERHALEDEILIVMEEIDASSKEMRLEEARLKSEKVTLEVFREKLKREVLGAEKELLTIREERTKIVDVIDREIYSLYMSLIESGNGIAVAEAKEAVCQGCNMNIPPQLFVEIKSNEEILQCPQCHRILYYKSDS
ncbi:MAG: C4-type zinc ribbon domain-containing protein [Nitrospirota bacterium]